MFCRSCGRQLAEGDVFCSKCGQAVASVPDTPSNQQYEYCEVHACILFAHPFWDAILERPTRHYYEAFVVRSDGRNRTLSTEQQARERVPEPEQLNALMHELASDGWELCEPDATRCTAKYRRRISK